MKGTIGACLPEKGYGFIKGDDGKDYYFRMSEFSEKDRELVCEAVRVEFEQKATPKGYQAKKCKVEGEYSALLYELPDQIISSRSSWVKGWEVIEESAWFVSGGPCQNRDDAKQELLNSAKAIGANAILNVESFKTTEQDGNYKYSVYSFKGRAATLAKKGLNGTYHVEDLYGLDTQALKKKNEMDALTKKSKERWVRLWLQVIIVSMLLVIMQVIHFFPKIEFGLLAVLPPIIGFFFINKYTYGCWLTRA